MQRRVQRDAFAEVHLGHDLQHFSTPSSQPAALAAARSAIRCMLLSSRNCDVVAGRLGGNQLGDLARDVCHRIFCSVQAASRAEQRTDVAESFIRCVVHDGDEQVAC